MQQFSFLRSLSGTLVLAFSCLILIFTGDVKAELLGDYIGAKNCAKCHEEIAASWEKTRHAGAFWHLKKEGKDTTPGCVKCHSVAYEQDGGFIDMELTPELAGVQCESCHGPGIKHRDTEDPGDIVRNIKKEGCRTCHTPGQDANFDFAEKIKKIHPVKENK
jgi:hypothetical protein